MATKRVDAYQEDYETDIPENPVEFLQWWKDKFDLVPEEFRATTKVEVDAESSYGDSEQINVTISYVRPETDEETYARERSEALREQQTRERDLRQLAHLAEKYK